MRRRLTVDPIRDPQAIAAIKAMLMPHARNHLLFVMGINSGLRAADLVNRRIGEFRGLPVGGIVQLRETKRGKENIILLNPPIHEALAHYFKAYPAQPDHWPLLFSQNRPGTAISTARVGDMVQEWAYAVGLKGHYGSHTLRKTWAYHARTVHKCSWEIICSRLGHSDPQTTRAYLGLQRSEVMQALMLGV